MCRDPWPRAGCGSSWRCRSPLDAGCHVPWSGPPSTLTVGVGSVLPSSGFFMLFQILLKCLLMQIFKFCPLKSCRLLVLELWASFSFVNRLPLTCGLVFWPAE